MMIGTGWIAIATRLRLGKPLDLYNASNGDYDELDLKYGGTGLRFGYRHQTRLRGRCQSRFESSTKVGDDSPDGPTRTRDM